MRGKATAVCVAAALGFLQVVVVAYADSVPSPGSPQFVSFSNIFNQGLSTTEFHISAQSSDGSALSYVWTLDPLPCGRLALAPNSGELNGYYHGPDATHPTGCPVPPGIEIQTVVHVTVYRAQDALPGGGIRAGAPDFMYSQVARAGDSAATTAFPKLVGLVYSGPAPVIPTAAPATAPPVSAPPVPSGALGNSGSGLESTFAASIPTPASAFSTSLGTLLLSALITLLLVLFVVFPSHLFNRTYEENHDRIRAAWERRLGWTGALRHRLEAGTSNARRGAFAFAIVVLIGALIGSLLDPGFGVNARTGTLILGIVLATLVGALFGGVTAGLYRRSTRKDETWRLHGLPSGLLVAGVCVLVSRLSGFQPGYLYGLIGGVAFAGSLTAREEGHATLVASVVTLLIAVTAWLVWVPIHDIASRSQTAPGFFVVLVENLLAAVFVGGLVGLVIGLVPLRFLPGEKLATWHRGIWALVFAISVFGLVQIMLRPQSAAAHAASVPFWTTVGLFLAFGAASTAFWGYFRVRKAPVTSVGMKQTS